MSNWKSQLTEILVTVIGKNFFWSINDFENIIGRKVTDHKDEMEIAEAVLQKRPDCSAFYFGNTLLFGDTKEMEDFIFDYRGF